MLNVMNAAQPQDFKWLVVIFVMGFSLWIAASFTCLLCNKSSLDGLDGNSSHGVALYPFRILLAILPRPFRIEAPPFDIARNLLVRFMPFLLTTSTRISMTTLSSIDLRELRDSFKLLAGFAEAWWHRTVSIVHRSRLPAMKPVLNLIHFGTPACTAKMIQSVFQSGYFLKAIGEKPTSAGVAKQFTALIWGRSSHMPMSISVSVCHTF